MQNWTSRAKVCGIGIVVAAGITGAAAAQDTKQDGKEAAPAVIVATVKDQEVTKSTQFVGRVQAIQQTDLKARVEGFLISVDFDEGAMVKANEPLYQIETGPYEAALAGAKAALASGDAAKAGAQAKLQDADLTLERQSTLLKTNTVSQAAVDKAQADRDQANAAVQSAEAQIAEANAQIQTAQLNLSYTKVVSPIDGRIGKTNYTKGNLVGPSSGTLSTVVQMDPMRVVFSISDRDYVNVIETAQHPGATDVAAAHAAAANADTTDKGTASTDGDAANAGATDAGATDAGAANADAKSADAKSADTDKSAVAPSPPETPNVDVKDDFVPTLVLPNGQTYAEKGNISFIDNVVDPNTGTIAVYADFPNSEFVLVPGQFVSVTVAVGKPQSLPVVPAGAVLQDKQGPYVLKLDKDNRAQIQRIETADKMQTGWAISSGLTQGDTIIVDGIQKVKPGMVVNPQTAKPAS